MAGIFDRLKTIFGAKADEALDKLEDPRQTLDYSYNKQVELLQKVRRGVAEVATSRKRVEMQVEQLNGQIAKMDAAAKKALEANREDLAREALSRKAGLQAQIGDLQTQYQQLQAEEEKLITANQRLQAKVDAFRTRKETIKASYSAAEAQVRINDAFSGLGEEMGNVGMAIQRAEDKTQQLQARASAVDELLASGALEDPTGGKDDITRELESLASDSQVDNELEALKRQLAIESTPVEQPRELNPGQPTWQQPASPQASDAAGQGYVPPTQGEQR